MEAGHEDIRSHVKIYIAVFVALMVLTVITVAVSYLHLSIAPAVIVALLVAIAKGSLVALYFMHLSQEKKAVYGALVLTVVFFLFLMFLPVLTELNTFGTQM